MAALGILFLIMLFVIVAFVTTLAHTSKEARAKKERQEKIIDEIEDKRGDHILFLPLAVYQTDFHKLGYPENYDGPVFLVSQKNGRVHFAYVNSPELELKSIEFDPRFEQKTSGKVSGRSGSSLIGAAWFGTTGAIIGGSGARNIDTTTRNQEINSSALLTFINNEQKNKFVIEVVANTATVYTLKKDFQIQ